ncbi:ClpP/crotonase-like domain-containing protein [Xylaria castorea]|nr:ClpP/crotonase-like domain-containing protein [Xylaria castorea]
MRSSILLFLTTWLMSGVLGSRITITKVTPSYWRATFSNPPFNLIDNTFLQEFHSLIDDIEVDPEVKVIVFDSSVEDFFIAHYDILSPADIDVAGPAYWGNYTRLANLPVLTVAAIRGIVRGGGAEMAAALDVRFGSKEKAIIGQPEVGLGAFPGGGGLRLLPGLVGRGRALEIVIGADDFDADTAALYGCKLLDSQTSNDSPVNAPRVKGINRAIPDDQFVDFVDKFARRVAGWDRYAIGHAKGIINQSGYPTVEEVFSDFLGFQAAVQQGAVPARLKAMAEAGFQSNVTFEINWSNEELCFVGPGPWDS